MTAGRERRLAALEDRVAGLWVPKATAELFARAAQETPSVIARDVLKVTLSAPQQAVLDDPARFKVCVWRVGDSASPTRR